MNTLRMLANVLRWLAIVALVAAGVFHMLAYAGVITLGDCMASMPWWLGLPCSRAWYVSRYAMLGDVRAYGIALGVATLAIVAVLIIRDAGKLRLFRRYDRSHTRRVPPALPFDDAGTIDVRPVLHVTSAKARKPRKGKRASEGTARRHAYRDPRTNKFVSRAAYEALIADGLAPRIV